MKNLLLRILKFSAHPRRMVVTMLNFLFHKDRAEVTVIWLVILIGCLFLFNGDTSAKYCNGEIECYKIDKNGDPVFEFNVEVPEEYNWTIFSLDRLAICVAKHETANCTLGYGKDYNNCFGLKDGNTAPCPKVGRNNMCIYSTPEESYTAFKKIWSKWYKGMPTLSKAQRYSQDRAGSWYKNVTNCYNNI